MGVTILDEPKHTTGSDGWIFSPVLCPMCGTRWTVSPEGEVGWWRWFFGILPKRSGAWFVKTYPAETGVSGTFLVTKCPSCRTCVMRRRRGW